MTQISIEEYTIKEVDKEILREESYFLLGNVIPNVEFVSVCIASKLFTSAFVEDELQVLRSDSDKVYKIISYIQKRGPDAFNKFLDALDKTDQGHVSKRLRKKRAQKSKKPEDEPNPSTWPTELPTVMKQKFLDTFERLQNAVVSDSVEKHSLNTIKFDHIERIVDEVLKSYAALLQDHSCCEKKLHEVGINENLIEGINSIIQSWKEREQEIQSLETLLKEANKKNLEYKKSTAVLDFELKFLKERQTKYELSKQKNETDLMQKIQILEKEKSELKKELQENMKLIKSYENNSICIKCSVSLATDNDVEGVRSTPWNKSKFSSQTGINKFLNVNVNKPTQNRSGVTLEKSGPSKTETDRKPSPEGGKHEIKTSVAKTSSENASKYDHGFGYGKPVKKRGPLPTLRPEKKKVTSHKGTIRKGASRHFQSQLITDPPFRDVFMPFLTKPLLSSGFDKRKKMII